MIGAKTTCWKWTLFVVGAFAVITALVAGIYFAKESPQSIRNRYASRQPEVLQIPEPIEVVDAAYWLDGGSRGITLRDSKGKRHSFCLDINADEKTHTFTIGSMMPSVDSRKLPDGSPEESDLYGILLRWVHQHSKRDVLLDRPITLGPKEFKSHEDWNLFGYTHMFFWSLDGRFVRK